MQRARAVLDTPTRALTYNLSKQGGVTPMIFAMRKSVRILRTTGCVGGAR